MSDDSQVIRSIDWRSTFPFVLIFRSFRIAIHPSKLLLALIAMFLIYLGGTLLDGVWNLSPKDRAVPGEVSLYVASRAAPDPRAWFIARRNESLDEIDRMYQFQLKQVSKSNPTLRDLEWDIKVKRDKRVAEIDTQYEKSPKKPEDLKRRDQQVRDEYEEASRKWDQAHAHEGSGLFRTLADHEIGQLNAVVRSVRTGNLFGPGGMTDALIGLFAWGPLWAMGHHYVYFSIFGLYFLIIWSIFGGAIARIAAVHIARDEKLSIRQALAFSMNKFLSFISAPIIPMILILILGMLVAAGGFIGNLPGAGPTIIGVFFFLALIASFFMALGLLGLIGGVNLMYPTIAVEGSDSFDAISRSFSYLYVRPWRLIFYSLVAIIYGAICYTFVRCFIYLMLWLTHLFAGLFFFYPANNGATLFSTMWPDPSASGRLTYEIDFLTLTAQQSVAAWLLSFWIYLTISLLGAFAICFYFSANTVIYFLMRNEVDATELDDVYLEATDEDFSDAPRVTTSVVEVTTTEVSPAPDQSPDDNTASA